MPLPRVLITMGDVAGIGPEVIAKAWPHLLSLARPVVIGNAEWLRRTVAKLRQELAVADAADLDFNLASVETIPVFDPSGVDLAEVCPGVVSASAGRAAYDYLCAAIDHTLAGRADAIVTCPLHKEGLRAAGIEHPGHTEILAERTGAHDHVMLLYGQTPELRRGLAVAHVTLHMALRDVFWHLTRESILTRLRLLDAFLRALTDRQPRLAVCGLNPHASDGGMFGDEEATIIGPAVAQARSDGLDAHGPLPADTVFIEARSGAFEGVLAMYHDQGHIPMKLLAGRRAVNVTVGLPIIRTSVAHGTAYDIVGQNKADPTSLIEATRVAARLVECRAFQPASARI